MKQLSLIDKIQVFFNNVLEHPLFIVILLVPVIIWLLQKKHGKKAFVIVYLLVILFVLYIGGDVIFKLFDNLMDGLFMTLYFPNFITLFVVVVACSIIALISFLSKKMYKINKIINIFSFALVQLLFVLILTIVKTKNINIYKDNALYVNNDVLTLMQLLIGVFTLQILAILIINAINKVTDILDKRGQSISLEDKKMPIKTLKIDNSKVGYINVVSKKSNKLKLKPFKFDIEKLEAVKLNTPVSNKKDSKIIIKPTEKLNDKEILLKENNISIFKAKPVVSPKIIVKPSEMLAEREFVLKTENPLKTDKKVSSFDKIFNLKPSEGLEKDSYRNNKSSKTKSILKESTDLAGLNLDNIDIKKKPDLLKPEKTVINVKPRIIKSSDLVNAISKKDEVKLSIKSVVDNPILVKKNMHTYEEDLVDNLNIINMQLTLDTVVKYRLMRVHLHSNKDAIDNLQIINFDMLFLILKKYKLYKTL